MADFHQNLEPTAVSSQEEDLIASPCISVCAVDRELGICIGCLRTLKEIGAWRVMSLAEKKAVVEACAERAKFMPRRGRDRSLLSASD
jgi:uncharacterized protein